MNSGCRRFTNRCAKERKLRQAIKSVIYSSPYVPPELIEACGFEPLRLVPGPCGHDAAIEEKEGMCAFMRMFCCDAARQRDVAAIVITSTCDQMRRGADLLAERAGAPVFILDVPAAPGSPSAHSYYRSELERLGRFLASRGGSVVNPVRLCEIMRAAAGRRKAGRAASRPASGVPVALIGGPVAQPDLSVLQLMESLGAAIVLNGLEGGEMTQPAEFSLRELDSDPMAVLADAYFGAIPSVFSRPNSALYQWLRRELPSSGAKGVVLLRYVWCDLWHAEVARLREWLKVPLLDIDLVGRDAPERSRTRLEAFLEGISKC